MARKKKEINKMTEQEYSIHCLENYKKKLEKKIKSTKTESKIKLTKMELEDIENDLRELKGENENET